MIPQRRWIAAGLLLLAAALGLACGSGGDDESAGPRSRDGATEASTPTGDDAEASTPTSGSKETAAPTDTPSSIVTPQPQEEGTPSTFEVLRDELASKLDAFGVNIGSLPPDIRAQVLSICNQLAALAAGDATQICQEIQNAIEVGDPAAIDRLLDQLQQLRPRG